MSKQYPPVLDVCCGARMCWHNKDNDLALFLDKRQEEMELCDGRKFSVAPNVKADFCKLPFPDDTFYLVLFDPPHMTSLGEKSWLAKKYGRLVGRWQDELTEGFKECLRVLRPFGTLVFKWNEEDVPLNVVLKLAPQSPLFGHTTGVKQNTHWLCFIKDTKCNGTKTNTTPSE